MKNLSLLQLLHLPLCLSVVVVVAACTNISVVASISGGNLQLESPNSYEKSVDFRACNRFQVFLLTPLFLAHGYGVGMPAWLRRVCGRPRPKSFLHHHSRTTNSNINSNNSNNSHNSNNGNNSSNSNRSDSSNGSNNSNNGSRSNKSNNSCSVYQTPGPLECLGSPSRPLITCTHQ